MVSFSARTESVASPEGYPLDHGVMSSLDHTAAATGGSVEFVSDAWKAVEDAEVVYSASWSSLDLHDQNEGLDKNGQFRFTPPTHTMLAFRNSETRFQPKLLPSGYHRGSTLGHSRLGRTLVLCL